MISSLRWKIRTNLYQCENALFMKHIWTGLCGVSMYWVSLEALLAMVCPRVSEQPPWTCVVTCV